MKAPSDGVIVRRNIKVSDMIMLGMLTIISKISVGQKLVVKIPSIKYSTVGTIKAIVPAVNPMTHKIQMRITFDRRDKNIFLGMYAKVVIKDKKIDLSKNLLYASVQPT